MSLTIKLERVYRTPPLSGRVNESCVCKVSFRQSFQTRSLRKTVTGGSRGKGGKSLDPMTEYEDDENHDDETVRKLLSRSNEAILFQLGEQLLARDYVDFECFKKSAFAKKPFGKYRMLLESLENESSYQVIDDNLVHPKSNLTIPERISFSIHYRQPAIDKRTGRVRDADDLEASYDEDRLDLSSDLNYIKSNQYLNHSINQFTKTTAPSHKKKCAIADESGSNCVQFHSLELRNAIGRATLTMAQTAFNPNMIISENSYEVASSSMLESVVAGDSVKSMSISHANPNQQSPINIFFYLLNASASSSLTSWQVKVQLIEIRNLFGNNKNIYCMVSIGDQTFKSSIKAVDKLRFNEVFTARFENVRSQRLLNKLISVSVYCKNFLRPDTLIGNFEIDFGTVYKNPTHEYYHKWGSIMAVEDQVTSVGSSGGGFSTTAVPKGYLKCDILVQAKGDKVLIHKEEADKDDEIDNNLILPYGLEPPRIMIKLVVNIRSAWILLKNPLGGYEKIKNQLSSWRKTFGLTDPNQSLRVIDDEEENESEMASILEMEVGDQNYEENIDEELNYFVRVTFMGATRQTALIRGTNKPCWDESFTFVYQFPGLIRLFKIELCVEREPMAFGRGSMQVLAAEYLDIENISEYKTNGYFLPTFGPANIDLYTEPHNYRSSTSALTSMHNYTITDLTAAASTQSMSFRNRGNAKTLPRSYQPVNGCSPGGGDYVARLMLSIKSSEVGFKSTHSHHSHHTHHGNTKSSPSNAASRRVSKFDVSTGVASGEATANNTNNIRQIKKKTFAVFVMISDAYIIDPRYHTSSLSFRLCVGPNGYDVRSAAINLTKSQTPIRLGPKMPCYLSIDKSKPCLTLQFEIEDLRYFMYCKNFLRNSVKELILSSVRLFEESDPKSIYEYYSREIIKIQTYIKTIYLTQAAITELEKNRARQLSHELTAIIEVVESLPNTDTNFRKLRYNQIRDCIDRIHQYLAEPFSFFPDVNLWLLGDGQPIGVCTIHSNDVVWARNDLERGCICNQLVYTNVKTLNQKDYENLMYENIARIRIYMWLGLLEDKENIFKGLSQGYGLSERYFNRLGLPTNIYYSERLQFELRCHMYQGRNLVGLDSTGLSDPYVKVTMKNQSVFSKVIKQTNNPKWNSTLVISEVNIYSTYEEVVENPPEIILELYDQDMLGADELMGKCYVKPLVQRSVTNPPKLKWYNVFLGSERAGDILASFELINLPPDYVRIITDKTQPISIPISIMPKTSQFTLEILFWGLRNIREPSPIFMGREKCRICIQIGDTAFESNPIDKNFANDNFLIIHKKEQIELPEEIEYKPHLNIKCMCENSFGGKQRLIGSYTVKTINDYFKDLGDLKEKYKSYIFKKRRFNHLMSQMSTYDHSENFMDTFSGQDEKNKKSVPKSHRKTASYSNESILDMEYLDWWSKYHASSEEQMGGVDKPIEKLMNIVKEISREKLVSSGIGGTGASETENNESVEDENGGSGDATFSNGKKFSKKKNRHKQKIKRTKETMRTKRLSSRRKQKKKKRQAVLNNEIDADLNQNGNNNSNIEKIEIFDTELEKVPSYSDKFDLLDTYPLYKGKNQPNQPDFINCYFKGKFLIYKENYSLNECFEHTIFKRHGGFLKLVPPNTPVQVKVRIYIIKAFLNSIRDNGLCDPFLSIQYGDQVIDDFESHRQNTVEPVFGQMYEYDLKFPYESQLVIAVKDWESIVGKKSRLIGKTTIDLEDRFYSNCYATCGLAKKYELEGYNRWRDILTPTQILNKVRKQWRLKKPEYTTDNQLKISTLDEQTMVFSLDAEASGNLGVAATNAFNRSGVEAASGGGGGSRQLYVRSDSDNDPHMVKERLALMALHNWQNITGSSLVIEHVETRSLFNPDTPGIEQGKLEMWIDMFPMEEINNMLSLQHPIPMPVDITPRKPKRFQLRVIIYNTEEVTLDDVNPLTGEKTSDIYVKGFVCDKINEAQSTDVHYRSMNGEGKFNWRFIFDFDYLPAEEMVVYKRKEHAFALQTVEHRMEPLVTLQCWDADVVSADDFLGSIELNLARMIPGAETARTCRLSMLKNKNRPTVNLFKVKNLRGWWPMAVFEGGKPSRLAGKVEAQFILLNEKQTEEKPAGLGRSEPDPLPEPNRPQESFLWFMSPLRTFKFIIWKNYKCFIIQMVALVLLIIFVLVFIFQLPSTIMNKALGTFG